MLDMMRVYRKLFPTSVCRVKNSGALHRTFNVDPLYLKHENSGRSGFIKARVNLLSGSLENLL